MRGSRRLRCGCGGSLTCGSLGGFVEPNQIFPRINNLTIRTRHTVLSQQLLVPKRGKKKDQHFLYPVNHLNQRKSSSAQLVSKEIETDLKPILIVVVVFFPKSRKVPELADLSIVCGGWAVRNFVKFVNAACFQS